MTIARDILWRRIMDEKSFEHGRFEHSAAGIRLSGTVLIAEDGTPLRVEYLVGCDAHWRTRSVSVVQGWQGTRSRLQLDHDGKGSWRLNGEPASALDGCMDVDLGVTPSTNALPVNRLGLAVGASKVIRAAWVRFPGLEVVAAEQEYSHLQDASYRYRSLASDFETIVRVDDDGLPVEYEGVWTRVADGPAAPVPPGALTVNAPFAGALLAPGPASELQSAADDFGWLVGGWQGEVLDFDSGGVVREAIGEWWFAWVLDGRTVQDVWIVPRRADRSRPPTAATAINRYGSTIRWFDRQSGMWRIFWFNPVSGAETHLAGRREGNRITLLGEEAGQQIRWTFNDITPDSFLWRGESRKADGPWQTEAEFRMRRIG